MTTPPPPSTPTRRSRRSLVLASALALGALGVAVVALSPTPRAQVPTEALLISQQCQTFQKATAYLSWRRPGAEDKVDRYLFHAKSNGKIGLDRVVGGIERVFWSGSQLTRVHQHRPTIRRIEGYDETIQDIWTECRSGFANSTWTTVPIPDGEPAGPRNWLRLELPFAWAQGTEINVGTIQNKVRRLSIRYPATDKPLSIAVIEANWNATFPDQALSPDLPPFSPPPWEGWTYQSNIGSNSNHPPINDGTKRLHSSDPPSRFELPLPQGQ